MFLEFLKQPKQKISKKRKKACFDNKPDYITVGGPGSFLSPPASKLIKSYHFCIIFNLIPQFIPLKYQGSQKYKILFSTLEN